MKKIILMLAFCGSFATMPAQVGGGSDKDILGNGVNTGQEDKSNPAIMQNDNMEKKNLSTEDKSVTKMQGDKDKCPPSSKQTGTKTSKYDVNTPNGTTGAQDDYMSGGGQPSKKMQNDHMKAKKQTGDHMKSGVVHKKTEVTTHKVASGKKMIKKETEKTPSGMTITTYTKTPMPEDHTAVSVPARVKDAFSNAYSSAKATWKREGENYRAMFKSNDKEALETIVVYDKHGKELVIEKELRSDACPTAVAKYCAKNERIWEVFEKGVPMKYFIQENGETTKWFDKNGNRIYGSNNTHGVVHHGVYSK